MKSLTGRLLAAACVVGLTIAGFAQQVADPDFDTNVANPAYTKKHPKVFLDEAHHNFHTASGRYKPFADLITSDGYQVIPNTERFSRKSLKDCDVLVISNALGARAMGSPEASNPAFNEEECDAVRDWVRAGGNLLLIADHAPMGAANERLSLRFGVDMSKGYTGDPANRDEESKSDTFIRYDRDNKLLGDHPITRGRNAGEKISKVIAFTGQSLKGPKDSVAFMRLADTAIDLTPARPDPSPRRMRAGSEEKQVSAAGRAQGIALKFGKGRVVVMAEAGMLSAQLMGSQKMKFGMNRPGIDNRQLALNIMHWLSRALN